MNAMMWYVYLLTWFPGVPIPQVEMPVNDMASEVSIAQGFADKDQCEAHAKTLRQHRASMRDHNYYLVFCHRIPPMP
jgi:hypothetical protein